MDSTTNHLLVPVDYSEKSMYGLQMADNLLNKSGGQLTVINILKGVDPIWSDFFTEEERQNLLLKLKKHLENFTAKYIKNGNYKVNYMISKGMLCDTILKTANELDVTKIIMGTSTADNIKKRIIGTNALRVVSEAHCPVITLKKTPQSNEINKIILPLDVSKETKEKVVYAVHLAKRYDAEIDVISAYTINDEIILKKLDLQQKQVVRFIKDHGIKCEGDLIKVKDRVDGVLKYMEDKKGDLVVITTHQQMELVSSFMGSFAKSIISKANIPVMSIVPKIKNHVIFKLPAS
ncbi:MAG: universal stress protein [Salinivirgaceae bacterium]|nr:universal stress protein [Salinivirgaceae bacterium]